MSENILSDRRKKDGNSEADVARFLGVTTYTVNRLAESEKLMDIDKYT